LFNLRDDPGEFTNLAGKPETAEMQAAMHSALIALVNPDDITEKAFETQERLLRSMAAEKGPEKLYQELTGRLGRGQARAVALKYRHAEGQRR
jgi:hypothetical protein